MTNNPHPLLDFIDREIKRTHQGPGRVRQGNPLWRDPRRNRRLRDRRENYTTDNVYQIREDFAQSILDLTGNKNPMLNYLDARIKEARITRNKAKKGTLDWKVAQTAVNELLVQRKGC